MVLLLYLLTADFTTANISDNQMYSILTVSLPVKMIKSNIIHVCKYGYDDYKLYNIKKKSESIIEKILIKTEHWNIIEK